jgi:hypothetical protein
MRSKEIPVKSLFRLLFATAGKIQYPKYSNVKNAAVPNVMFKIVWF